MTLKSFIASFAFLLVLFIAGCKKHQQESSSAAITSFIFSTTENPSLSATVYGQIALDTILVGVPQSVNVSALIPTITITGQRVSPAGNAPQNFTNPVRYTVTAQDGTSMSYVVVVYPLSDSKAITAFVFRQANNPGITADVTGTITGDSIRVYLAPTTNLKGLVPSIVYTGKSISPADSTAEDFSVPVQYVVSAADGTSKTYTVIASVNVSLYVASNDSYLYALDAATGALQWKTATGGAINSSPTVAGGMVYAGSNDGNLYAFDASSGAIRWKYPAYGPVTGSPTVSNGIVYIDINTGNSLFEFAELVALNAATGAVVWQYQFYPPDVGSSVTVSGNSVYLTEPFTLGLAVFDASTGAVQWDSTTNGLYTGNPAIANGTIYVGGVYGIAAAFDQQTHAQKWYYYINDIQNNGIIVSSIGSPTVDAANVYIPASDGNMYALDVNTGEPKWKQNTGTGNFSTATRGDGMIFTTTSGGNMYALDTATGAVKWTNDIALSGTGHGNVNSTFANGILYLGNPNGVLYAIDAASGDVKWSFATGGSVYAGPCVIDSKGNVYHPAVSGDQQ